MFDYEKTSETKKVSTKDADLLSDIRKFREHASSYWDSIYQQGRADKEFVTVDGAQWDVLAVAQRKEDNLPSLEINLVRTYCRQQINTQRQNRPQIDPVPVDSFADIETAKTIKGLVKDTEIVSDAESAYDASAENAVYGGIGFIRVITDYVSADSFDQEPRIVAVHNSESVYIEPESKALDGSDNTKALVMSWVSKETIEDKYGEDAVVSFDNVSGNMEDWINKEDNKVLIAEYFCLDKEMMDLHLLQDGTTVWDDQKQDGMIIIQTRKSAKRIINWYKVSGNKVLERTTFVGDIIPVVPVYGEVTWIGEKRYVFSLVHFAKDPQRLYNYWKSTEAHQLSEMSDTPDWVTPEQIEGFESDWKNPKGLKVKRYNRFDENGNDLGLPQRQGFVGSPTGILNAAMGAQQSITDVLNMHAPAMGSAQNDQSGVALGKLQSQQETSNFHFADNLNKSIAQVGRILLPCYQAFYSDERVKRIMGEDGKPKMVTLNAPPTGELKKGQELSKNGWLNDLTVGRYDVRMQTGANYNTQRQQTADLLQGMIKAAPQIMTVAPDLVMRTIDGVGIQEIADRLERTVPPQVKDDPTDKQQLPPEVQQQMQQLDGLVQQQQQQLQELGAAVNDKKAERDHKTQLAELDANVKIEIARMNNDSKADVNELTQAVKLMLANMQPPTQLINAVDEDLQEDSPYLGQYQEERPNMEQTMPQEQQQPYAPDTSQIGNNALPTAAEDVNYE